MEGHGPSPCDEVDRPRRERARDWSREPRQPRTLCHPLDAKRYPRSSEAAHAAMGKTSFVGLILMGGWRDSFDAMK